MQEDKTQNETKSAKDVARFLWNAILFGAGSYVINLAWNLGLASLFPTKIPRIGFIHAYAWLIMLYIISTVIATARMGVIERAIRGLFDDLQEGLEYKQDLIQTTKSNNQQDKSDIN